MRGEDLAGGLLAIVDGGHVAVAGWVVVTGVNDNLARQRLHGNLRHGPERDRHDDQIAGRRGLVRGGSSSFRAKGRDQWGQRFGSPGVAHHDVVASGDNLPGENLPNIAATDEANDGYGVDLHSEDGERASPNAGPPALEGKPGHGARSAGWAEEVRCEH